MLPSSTPGPITPTPSSPPGHAPFCAWHRMPQARIDPITDANDALAVISVAIHRPLVAETIVLVLDDARCGMSLITVSGTVDDDSVIDIVDCFATMASDVDATALVVASIRPSHRPISPISPISPVSPSASTNCSNPSATPIVELDIERWIEASDTADCYGIELLEWFVIGGTADPTAIHCPRDLFGERPRW